MKSTRDLIESWHRKPNTYKTNKNLENLRNNLWKCSKDGVFLNLKVKSWELWRWGFSISQNSQLKNREEGGGDSFAHVCVLGMVFIFFFFQFILVVVCDRSIQIYTRSLSEKKKKNHLKLKDREEQTCTSPMIMLTW